MPEGTRRITVVQHGRLLSTVRLGTIMVRHGTATYPDALPTLRQVLARIGQGDSPILIVDNADEHLPWQRMDATVELMGGDNSAWEFSGWQKGVTEFLSRYPETEVLLFVTDAFVNSRKNPDDDYTKTTGQSDVAVVQRDQAIIGLLYPQDFYFRSHHDAISYCLEKWRFEHWLRTAYFYLSRTTVNRLLAAGGFVTYGSVAAFCPENFAGEIFLESAPIDKCWREKLQNWLTTDWYRSAPITPARWGYVRAKALAILNEHALYFRLRDMKTPVIDLRWLRWAEGRWISWRATPEAILRSRQLVVSLRHILGFRLPLVERCQLVGHFFWLSSASR